MIVKMYHPKAIQKQWNAKLACISFITKNPINFWPLHEVIFMERKLVSKNFNTKFPENSSLKKSEKILLQT